MIIAGQIDCTVPPGPICGNYRSFEAAGAIVGLAINTGETGDVALQNTGAIARSIAIRTDVTGASRANQAIRRT